MLRNHLTCERRVWLDTYGDSTLPAETPPDILHVYALGNAHEQAIQAATAHHIEPIPLASWAEGVEVTRRLMRQGVPGIIQARLEIEAPVDASGTLYRLRGVVDRLVRLPGHSRPIYAPVEIKQYGRSEEADWLQLDYYVWLLDLIQGVAPPGELWLSADEFQRPRQRLLHEYDEERVTAALRRVADLLAESRAPAVKIASYCKSCPWLAPCQQAAQAEQSIDLLYAVSHVTRRNMRAAGFNTLAAVVACSPEDLQQVKGIGPATAPVIHANARAWLENRPVLFNPLAELCQQPGWMFDLETREMGGKTVPWSLGWCDTEGNTHVTLVAPVQMPETRTLPDGQSITLAPDSDAAWDVMADTLAGDDCPIYHWTGYDSAILHGSASGRVRAALGPRMHDLHATVRRTASFPLNSTSIKPISAYLGYPWPGYNHWLAAYLDYLDWLERGTIESLMRACMYQRADVQSMAWVWRWLTLAPHA
jgi:predicted RecB family nuclease